MLDILFSSQELIYHGMPEKANTLNRYIYHCPLVHRKETIGNIFYGEANTMNVFKNEYLYMYEYF